MSKGIISAILRECHGKSILKDIIEDVDLLQYCVMSLNSVKISQSSLTVSEKREFKQISRRSDYSRLIVSSTMVLRVKRK